MWSFGYTDPFGPEGTEDVYMGESVTMREALSTLIENVEKMAADAESYADAYFEAVISDIREKLDDPGFVDDPDMWEDLEFTDEIGEMVFYVVES